MTCCRRNYSRNDPRSSFDSCTIHENAIRLKQPEEPAGRDELNDVEIYTGDTFTTMNHENFDGCFDVCFDLQFNHRKIGANINEYFKIVEHFDDDNLSASVNRHRPKMTFCRHMIFDPPINHGGK